MNGTTAQRKRGRGASPETMRELTRQRVAKRAQRPPALASANLGDEGAAPAQMTSPTQGTAPGAPSVMDVIRSDFPQFTATSWASWRAFAKAIFGEPLSDLERTDFQDHTGRLNPPVRPVREAWCIVGRRGGKSVVAALIAVYKAACCGDYKDKLAPGEKPTVAVIAADRRQASVVFGYVTGLLDSVPTLRRMIARRTKDAITLKSGVRIEIHTSSFRTSRGYTLIAAICDEVAFWRSEDGSTNPDTEILAAVRPGLMTLKGPLICITTPYSRRGAAWEAYKQNFGKDESPVLVWTGSSASMNPGLDPEDIRAAYEADPQAASAEYGGEFRSDIDAFISEELLIKVVASDRRELPPVAGVAYVAFCDPSGGSQDSYTIAVAHRDKDADRVVLDLVREAVPPFSPEAVTETFAEVCTSYKIKKVTGDRYGGEFPRELFRKHGIDYAVSEETKSEIYLAALPMLTSGRVELLDDRTLLRQFRGLERRTGRSGKDSVDHGPRGRDDVANSAAGALVLAKDAAKSFGFLPMKDVGNLMPKRVSPELARIVRGFCAAGDHDRAWSRVGGGFRVPGNTSSRGTSGLHPHERE